MVDPRAAVVAAEDPEMAAKKHPETETVCASPPLNDPTSDCENDTSRAVTPPADMKAPASIKNGTAINEKESMPEYMICVTITRGISIKKKRITETERQSPKATGTPTAVSNKNIPNNISPIFRPLIYQLFFMI
jgi:hypothetical protein